MSLFFIGKPRYRVILCRYNRLNVNNIFLTYEHCEQIGLLKEQSVLSFKEFMNKRGFCYKLNTPKIVYIEYPDDNNLSYVVEVCFEDITHYAALKMKWEPLIL